MNEIMTSNKPYLLRAIHEWICDNDCTPYLYVNTDVKGLHLPAHLLTENPLILNASLNACRDFDISSDAVSFQARFSGEVFDVYLPNQSILAIVARENGLGMTFEWEGEEVAPDDTENDKHDAPSEKGKSRSKLRVVR